MSGKAPRSAYWHLHTAVFLFGFTGILGELIQLDATMLVWHRMWMTAIMMGIYVRVIGVWRWPGWKAMGEIAAVSSAIVAHWVLFYASIKYASVSVAMICLSSITLFTALLEPLLLKRRFSWWEGAFSVLVIVGVAFMAEDQNKHIGGILIGLASSFFSALFTVLNKRMVGKYDSRLLSMLELSSGFALLTVLLPLVFWWMPAPYLMPVPSDWLYLFCLSFFCTVVAFNLSLSSLRYLSPFTVNLAINLEPVYGILLAFAVFKEYEGLGPGFYLGAVCILMAVTAEILYKRFALRA
jgi:drug/metabolite transporter (DMT)-like permease